MPAEDGNLNADYAALQRYLCRLGAIGHAELAQDVIDMGFDGRLTDPQSRRNLPIAIRLDYQFQHFQFAGGQLRAPNSPGQPLGYSGRNPSTARMDGSNCAQQFLGEHIFEEVAASAGLQSPVYILVAII